jgi:MoxR-like ATPase
MQSTEAAALDADIFDGIANTRQRLTDAIHQAVIGQDEVIELVLITLLAQGHALLIGVPGLAKTLLVRTVADALGLGFRRIQFTPDLMPTDILGTEVLEEDRQSGSRSFRFVPGPVFTHLLLADEINRTPPKTQAALLEAMQESAVTVAGETRTLESPFCVLATQNPIEQREPIHSPRRSSIDLCSRSTSAIRTNKMRSPLFVRPLTGTFRRLRRCLIETR